MVVPEEEEGLGWRFRIRYLALPTERGLDGKSSDASLFGAFERSHLPPIVMPPKSQPANSTTSRYSLPPRLTFNSTVHGSPTIPEYVCLTETASAVPRLFDRFASQSTALTYALLFAGSPPVSAYRTREAAANPVSHPFLNPVTNAIVATNTSTHEATKIFPAGDGFKAEGATVIVMNSKTSALGRT